MNNAYALHVLNLTNSLSLFQSCTIHIIFNQIRPQNSENYLLDPPFFPIVTSLHQYYPNNYNGHFICKQNKNSDKTLHILNKTHSEFKFRKPRNPRLTCGVTVIIDPVQCLKWEHSKAIDTTQPEKSYGTNLMDTFMDPIYNLDMTYALGLYKQNWIWIHVEQFSEYSSFLILYSSDLLFVLEHKTNLRTRLPRISIPKLLYQIHNVTDQNSQLMHTVRQVYSVGYRKALKPLFSLIEQFCKIRHSEKFQGMSWYDCSRKVGWTYSYMTLTSIDINIHKNITSLMLSIEEDITELVVTVTEQKPSFSGKTWMAQKSSEIITSQLMSNLFINTTIFYDNSLAALLFLFPVVKTRSSFLPTGNLFHDEPFPLHFLSCTVLRKSDGLSLKDLVSAFYLETWLSLIIFAVISGLFLNQTKGKNIKSDYFTDLTFVYNLLLNQPCSAFKKWKWTFAPWLLAAIVFSYSYQGENIVRLSRSLRNSPIDSFDEILTHNFSIYSPGTPVVVEAFKNAPKFVINLFMETVSLNFTRNGMSLADMLITKLEFNLRQHIIKSSSIYAAVQRLLMKPKNFQELLKISEISYLATKISKCKSHALIDNFDSIAAMYLRLQKQDSFNLDNLHISSNPIEKVFREWTFDRLPIGANRFSVRLAALVHSGLVELWLTQTKYNLPIDVRNTLKKNKIRKSLWKKPKKLSLKGNFAVVFYMLLSLLGIPCLIFAIELAGTMLNYLLKIRMLVWSAMQGVKLQFICRKN